jgi:hypothetical protein
LKDSGARGGPSVGKGAAATRKRKGPTKASREAKRRAHSPRPDPVEQGSSGSNVGSVERGSGKMPVIQVSYVTTLSVGGDNRRRQCDRCVEKNEPCEVTPRGACMRCKRMKQSCSLMPKNPRTGKTDRRARSEAQYLEYRIKQAEDWGSEVKRGKRPARDSSDPGESEGSGPAPSPLAVTAGLGVLSLDSGGSSAADTPADTPPTLPQLPSPLRPSPAPPEAQNICEPSSSAGASAPKPLVAASDWDSAAITAEAPSASALLNPAHRQAHHFRDSASPVSDGRSNAARIAALETMQDEMERRMREFDARLKKLGV